MIFISLVVESMMTISGFGPSAAKMRFLMRADDPVLPSRTVNPSTMKPSCVQSLEESFSLLRAYMPATTQALWLSGISGHPACSSNQLMHNTRLPAYASHHLRLQWLSPQGGFQP